MRIAEMRAVVIKSHGGVEGISAQEVEMPHEPKLVAEIVLTIRNTGLQPVSLSGLSVRKCLDWRANCPRDKTG